METLSVSKINLYLVGKKYFSRGADMGAFLLKRISHNLQRTEQNTGHIGTYISPNKLITFILSN